MKFACPNCDSKYTIADERVRSKVLKIRCKSCNNIIEVREPKAKSTGAAPKVSKKAPSALENRFADSFRKGKAGAPKPKGTPGLYKSVKRSAEVLQKEETDFVHWFVAIDNCPFGPVSARKIHSHKQTGKVTDSSLVWKEGMADWAPVRNCKELVGLLAKIDLQGELLDSKDEQDNKKLGLFADEKETLKSPLKGGNVGVIAKREDEKTGSDEVAETKDSAATKEPVPKESVAPAEAEDAFFEKSGGAVQAPSRDSLMEQQISNLTPLRPNAQGQNRWIMIAAVGFLVVAMVTLGVAVMGGSDTGEIRTSVETVEKIVERVVYLDRPLERVDGPNAPDVIDVNGESSSGGKSGSRYNKNKTKKQTEADAKTKALMEQMGLSTPGGVVPIGGMQKKQSSSGSSSGAGSLTANQVKKVVDRNKGRLKSCYERALKHGDAPDDTSIRVDFKLKVGSSGMVKSTKLGGAGAKIDSLNQCLTRSVKKWVFPASSATSPVEFPFVFTPK